MEDCWVSKTQKNYVSKKKIEDNTHFFLGPRGNVHREFVPLGMTVNAAFFYDVLRRLRENVRRKSPQKWQYQNLIIDHDNAPTHMSFNVSKFLIKNNVTVIPHHP